MTTFNKILTKYRKLSFSERDKGDRFEKLIQNYFLTDPKYSYNLKKVWLWNEFPSKKDFGGKDTGIDLVALTIHDEYWAIQCKCFDENTTIDKKAVDSFLSTSSKTFKNEQLQIVGFSQRLWVSTTNKWGSNAEETIKNQNPPVTRINLSDLQQAPVDWDKIEDGISGELARNEKKSLRPHQTLALEKTNEYLKDHDRGKLIMACGTGKTFTSLRIAENETNGNGLVLFLVPSIALLGQTLREWTADALEPITPICICSDTKITKQKANDDLGDTSVVDLALPATTDVKSVVTQFKNINRNSNKGMTVVFSTYQSIDVIATAQQHLLKEGNDNAVFDLIICDEAHRTTGVSLTKEDSSSFIKVHDNDYIKAQKRLYMTATPRLYSEDSISKAQQNDAIICSMDDINTYGEEIYRIGFGEAVENDLLTDYKVLILTLNEKDVPASVQSMIAGSDNEISSDDASKLIGCINALSKQVLGDEGLLKGSDPEPMKRAVAFCQNIKVSNHITNTFNQTKGIYLESLPAEAREKMVSVSSRHIDGSMNAPTREELLEWLKSSDTEPNECRILTNVRCLSEGVDVPSLDAVLFLSARNSQVDVVQSVGRVMRKAEGKKYGYIIIPVVVPSDVDASKALDNNDRFKVVWTVLNALRAHDDRFNATINKIDLNKKKPSQILVGGASHGNDEGTGESNGTTKDVTEQLALQFQELQGIMYAKMVQKVGDRVYWEKWAKDVAKIAEDQISRIKHLITTQPEHKEAFDKFLQGLQKNINPSISESQAIEMLSQHIITKPVFEALFEGYSFVKNNAISTSMQAMLDVLESTTSAQDFEVLDNFYQSVKKRASGIDNAEGKQKIIIELYDKFFKTAFPKMVEQLGIVYTPVEVVDFIIHSVNDVLKSEFGRTISDENIHILDPFTGTGTFIVRLLQSGLITQEDLHRKYTKELHANEIVLLAYYIAAVNIENAFHDATEDPEDGIGKEKYIPFDGIVLTDTFQLGETDATEKLFSEMFPQNSERVQKQKSAPIRVIIGNPPYSVGQKSKNDNAQNQSYSILDSKISKYYVKESLKIDINSNSLKKFYYDPYIKAFRWSTDRLDPKNGGIIAFVSNGGWLDSNSLNGFRKALEKEFSSIYVFNLRGNQITSGELSRKEGGKIFGSGSRTPISITLLVKNPLKPNKKADIFYHDIGDYLSRDEKLKTISKYKSFSNLPLEKLTPNEMADWLNLRNDMFSNLTELAPDNKFNINTKSFFIVNTNGVVSGRSHFVYNYSKSKLSETCKDMISFFNTEQMNFQKSSEKNVEAFVNKDEKFIKWDDKLFRKISNGASLVFEEKDIRISFRTPFCKEYIYFNETWNWSRVLLPIIFPNSESDNLIISTIGKGASRQFSVLISNNVIDYHFEQNGQCFPLYYYEENKVQQRGLFDEDNTNQYIRRDGVSDFILTRATKQYGNSVSKEDIFYYVYGILHSPDYRATFANDLKKMLPRIPLVEEPRDFWKFSKAGRALAELHLNYESVEPYQGVMVLYNTIPQEELEQGLQGKELETVNYKVQKMRFPKKGEKSSIIYNSQITIDNIPEKAYDYVVNGKSAIEWIMERYQVTTDAKSGITNNPNDWSEETGNPKYILNLLLSIINVSVQTVDIVESLPKLKFE